MSCQEGLSVVGKLKVLLCRHYSCGGMYWESGSVAVCAHGDKWVSVWTDCQCERVRVWVDECVSV